MRFVVLKLKSLTSCFPSNKEPPSALLLSTSEKPENGWSEGGTAPEARERTGLSPCTDQLTGDR